ncbi:tRNA dihydrouridine synthase DusB [Acuticoccus sp. MNP-M23]|uniref:tRNA dihydrouridine synthase DusB n=1 Tax=Acuticoccus sp. MNP-M23 TaxID=3072793 RepID=UPI002816400C|nr:tRNA dihydrouridine synthase DusB [Acuticoccus sp. MNP-M23]WMS42154.1 tRNA dihydrouridine synthase DusB [Acuticoccus sp. MNP-M23]
MNVVTVGSLAIKGRAFLAPMSGISDWPFRRLAARFGASLVVSEMVASDRLIAREAETRLKLEGAGLDIHAVQLAGCRAQDLAEAARLAEAAGAHLIDINMGCPAKRVVGGWAGSALMRDLDHAARLIAATVAAVSVPVTVKMRLGYDRTNLNAPELARRAEAEGAKLVTVHGRTRCQKYKGCADWAAIAPVKRAVLVPVIANGDCAGIADARAMMAASGADGVMVGRASLGAPWLPGAIAAALDGKPVPNTPSLAERAAIAQEHLDMLSASAGPILGVRLMRKHTAAYIDGLAVPEALRRAALTAETPRIAAEALRAVFDAAEPMTGKAAA